MGQVEIIKVTYKKLKDLKDETTSKKIFAGF